MSSTCKCLTCGWVGVESELNQKCRDDGFPVFFMEGCPKCLSIEIDYLNSRQQTRLPNGCTLYWEENAAGGRTYYSDEIGCGVTVWDTSLIDPSTLTAAIHQENILEFQEEFKK